MKLAPQTKATVRSLLGAVAWLLFAMAGLAFLLGGWAISEFAKTERMLAEMEGIALTFFFGVFGAVATVVKQRLEEGDENKTSLFSGGLFRK